MFCWERTFISFIIWPYLIPLLVMCDVCLLRRQLRYTLILVNFKNFLVLVMAFACYESEDQVQEILRYVDQVRIKTISKF